MCVFKYVAPNSHESFPTTQRFFMVTRSLCVFFNVWAALKVCVRWSEKGKFQKTSVEVKAETEQHVKGSFFWTNTTLYFCFFVIGIYWCFKHQMMLPFNEWWLKSSIFHLISKLFFFFFLRCYNTIFLILDQSERWLVLVSVGYDCSFSSALTPSSIVLPGWCSGAHIFMKYPIQSESTLNAQMFQAILKPSKHSSLLKVHEKMHLFFGFKKPLMHPLFKEFDSEQEGRASPNVWF